MSALRPSLLARLLPLRALNEPRTVVLLFALLFAYIACGRIFIAANASANPLGAANAAADPDAWWIAAVGRDALARHAMPQTNGYSFTDASHPWVMHEGLFALVFAQGAALFGPAPFFAIAGVISAATTLGIALAYLFARGRVLATGALAALLVLLGCSGALFQARPSYASFAFVAATIALAFSGARWSAMRAAAAIVLTLLWTNAHGSFPLGVALLGLAAVSETHDPRDRRARALTCVAAAAVTFMNPYGARLHGLVDRYLRGGDETAALIHGNIAEFAPLWRAQPPFADAWDITALVAIACLAAAALKRRRHLARALFVGALLVMAVYQARHAMLAIFTGALLLHHELDDRFASAADPDASSPPTSSSRRRRAQLALFAVAPGLLAASVLWVHQRRGRTAESWVEPPLGGASMLALLADIPDGANVWAPFQPSAVVLWYGSPRGIRVFFDPRNDCYSPKTARTAFALERNGGDAATTLRTAGTDYVLVDRAHPVHAALAASADWRLARREGAWLLFARAP